jgi:hypothetical protein
MIFFFKFFLKGLSPECVLAVGVSVLCLLFMVAGVMWSLCHGHKLTSRYILLIVDTIIKSMGYFTYEMKVK